MTVSRRPRRYEPELHRMLDQIDSFLADNRRSITVRMRLWDALTALRGPDNGNAEVKMTTTAPLRTAMFPKTARRFKLAAFAPVSDFVMPSQHDHFANHVYDAARALGLGK